VPRDEASVESLGFEIPGTWVSCGKGVSKKRDLLCVYIYILHGVGNLTLYDYYTIGGRDL
jgi:hypothetical protein